MRGHINLSDCTRSLSIALSFVSNQLTPPLRQAPVPILLCTGLLTNSTYGISLGLVLGGFGNGIGVTTSLIGLIANASPADQAVATACSYLFRSLGSVVGLSLSATVVQQSLRNQLGEKLGGKDAEEVVRRVRESLDFIRGLEPEVREVVRACYGAATRQGFGLMLGIVSFAMLSSCERPFLTILIEVH